MCQIEQSRMSEDYVTSFFVFDRTHQCEILLNIFDLEEWRKIQSPTSDHSASFSEMS